MDTRDRLEPHPVLPKYYADHTQRPGFVSDIFDKTAAHYDRISHVFSLGSGDWYRRRALARCGLHPGVDVLDVAVGTGLVARQALALTGHTGLMAGIDLSHGMLEQARRQLSIPLLLGTAEHLPVKAQSFDFVTVGYALRHFTDLHRTFAEFRRVLRPGGCLVVLEIAKPKNAVGLRMTRWYLGRMVPALSGLTRGRRHAKRLMQYYWDTIEHCVDAAQIMASMDAAGFTDVADETAAGVFKTYTGTVA